MPNAHRSRLILPKGRELLKATEDGHKDWQSRTWQPCLQKNLSTGHPTIKRLLIYWTSVLSRALPKIAATPNLVSNSLQITFL